MLCVGRHMARSCRFILKTDDDAFVNVPAFVQQLRLLCESPDCRKERLYMGKQCRRGKVIMSQGTSGTTAATTITLVSAISCAFAE